VTPEATATTVTPEATATTVTPETTATTVTPEATATAATAATTAALDKKQSNLKISDYRLYDKIIKLIVSLLQAMEEDKLMEDFELDVAECGGLAAMKRRAKFTFYSVPASSFSSTIPSDIKDKVEVAKFIKQIEAATTHLKAFITKNTKEMYSEMDAHIDNEISAGPDICGLEDALGSVRTVLFDMIPELLDYFKTNLL